MKTIRTVSAAYLRRQESPQPPASLPRCATCDYPALGRTCLKCATPGEVLRLWAILSEALANPPSAAGAALDLVGKGVAEVASAAAARRRITPILLLLKGVSQRQLDIVRHRYTLPGGHAAYTREIGPGDWAEAERQGEEFSGKAAEGRSVVRGIRARWASWEQVGEKMALSALDARRQYAAASYRVSKAQRSLDLGGWVACLRAIADAERNAEACSATVG